VPNYCASTFWKHAIRLSRTGLVPMWSVPFNTAKGSRNKRTTNACVAAASDQSCVIWPLKTSHARSDRRRTNNDTQLAYYSTIVLVTQLRTNHSARSSRLEISNPWPTAAVCLNIRTEITPLDLDAIEYIWWWRCLNSFWIIKNDLTLIVIIL